MSLHIGFLEDEPFQARVIETLFQQAGYSVWHASDVRGMKQLLIDHDFDLLLLDWMLPDGTAEEVIQHARTKVDWHLPILVLSAQDDEETAVRALQLGADDFVYKPLRRNEMLARIESQLRRSGKNLPPGKIKSESLRIENHQCQFQGRQIKLSEKEMDLLGFLLRNQGALLSRTEILKHVWDISADINTRTVDTHISRLRTKLRAQGVHTAEIAGVHGHGYRMEIIEDVG